MIYSGSSDTDRPIFLTTSWVKIQIRGGTTILTVGVQNKAASTGSRNFVCTPHLWRSKGILVANNTENRISIKVWLGPIKLCGTVYPHHQLRRPWFRCPCKAHIKVDYAITLWLWKMGQNDYTVLSPSLAESVHVYNINSNRESLNSSVICNINWLLLLLLL